MYLDHYLTPSSQEQEPPEFSFSQTSNGNGNGNGSNTSKEVWSALLAPIATPKCNVHGEPAKEFTVNKQGPNKGKRFFICAR
jgi:AP endonuclease-2